MKDLYMAAHEALIAEYEDAHPNATDAYERTADAAYGRMTDMLADRIDAARDRMKYGD